MIALGTRAMAEAVFVSGARDAFMNRGLSLDRISKAAGCPSYAAMLTGREVAGLTYGLQIGAEEAATIAYGGERTSTQTPKPTEGSLSRLIAMPQDWWTSPTVSVAGLLDEDTTPAELAMLLGTETGDLNAPGEARLCALAGQKISDLWGIAGATPIHDHEWITALDDAHRRLATKYVPSVVAEDEQDLYHVSHLPRMSVAKAIEVVGSGTGIVVSIGNGKWAQVRVSARKSGELALYVNGLNTEWREARYSEGLDGLRAVGFSLSDLAEDFNKRNPRWADWKAVALRMPSGLLARDRQQAMVA